MAKRLVEQKLERQVMELGQRQQLEWELEKQLKLEQQLVLLLASSP